VRLFPSLPIAALAALACAPVDTDRAPAAEAAPAQSRDLVGRTFDARVVRVADGDTLEAIPAGESRAIRIRLQGVDAPEQGEPFSREATALVRTLLFDRRVQVSGRDVDRFGRLVARVTASGTDASVALVRAGLACHAYVRDPALASDESRARAAGAGFWAGAAPKPACVTQTALSARPALETPRAPSGRSDPRAAATGPLHGNVSSLVYHTSSCPNYRCRNCTRVFASEAEARAAGFRPAGDCTR
jgi:endonuclease YncB( thermonuclease family)